MGTVRDRLARERARTEEDRLCVTGRKMDLLVFASRYQGLAVLAQFWPEIERAVLVLGAEAAPTLADLSEAPYGQVLDLTNSGGGGIADEIAVGPQSHDVPVERERHGLGWSGVHGLSRHVEQLRGQRGVPAHGCDGGLRGPLRLATAVDRGVVGGSWT